MIIFKRNIKEILAKKLDILGSIYLDDIFIYFKDSSGLYVNVIRWVFEELLEKYYFVKIQKCLFHKKEIYFLKGIKSKNWPELRFVQDV